MRTGHIGCIRGVFRSTALALGLVVASAGLAQAQELFTLTKFSQPVGIAADVAGSVFVDSDIISTTAVTRFTPTGVATRQSPGLGAASAGFLGHLEVDPTTGLVFLLTRAGQILALRPDTLEGTLLVDLNMQLAFKSFPDVFDVSTGNRQLVVFGTPVWGDIALRRIDAARLDMFVTGTATSDGFPFVMRVRVDFQSGAITAQIMAFSAGIIGGGPGVNAPRGVAVSPDGLVLTSLPLRPPGVGTLQDVGVALSGGFPQDTSVPPTVVLSFLGMTSRGMTSDAAGNFYVAAGAVGSPACGPAGNGALLFIPRALNRVVCFNAGGGTNAVIRSTDVAVDPRDRSVLVAFDEGVIVRFPAFPTGGRLEEFVRHFYEDVLGRQPEEAGAAAWLAFLAGTCNAAGFGTIAQGFFGSAEFQQARPLSLPDLVATLYRTFLQREPEAGGLAGWSAVFRAQRLAVARGFILSPEFQALLPDRTNRPAVSAVITRLYQQILQREPDAAGLAGWVDYVTTTGDLEGASAGFLASQEFEGRPLSQSGYVTILYRTFLGREPDPAGLEGWTAALGNHLLGVVNNGFVPSTEFQSRVPEVCGG